MKPVIIGIATHIENDDLVNRLHDGTFQLVAYVPVAELINNALYDAGEVPGDDTALILLGNSARPSSWPGPVHGATSLSQALLLAQTLLADQIVRMVVLAEAATGAVVLAAGLTWPRVYAVIESSVANPVALACLPDEIGYLELTHLMPEDTSEVNTVMSAYRAAGSDLTCAIGSSGGTLMALIKTALCVYHRFLPALTEWPGPADPASWQDGPFYAVTQSKTWFLEQGQTQRRAAISLPDAHIVLAEHLDGKSRPNTSLSQSPQKLFIVTANDGEALLAQLHLLAQSVHEGRSLPDVANDFATLYQEHPGMVTVVFVAHHPDDLAREIQLALKNIPQVIEQGGEWFTPRGSYFTANPLGPKGKIAFVYPGAFNSYPKMGQDLLFLFPYLHEDLINMTSDLGQAVGDVWLYPRSLEKQTARHWKQVRKHLEDQPTVMAEAGVTSSAIFTRLVRNFFKIQPDMAMGYSLGESSMLFGLGIWAAGDEGHTRLVSSPIYQGRLSGPKSAVREAWGLSPDAPNDFWSVYFIAAPAEVVNAQVQKESRVYLTHINTYNEVVIAGEREACKRVVAALDAEHLHASFDMVIHCDITFLEYQSFCHLHDYPVHSLPDVVLYSAADYEPVTPDSAVIAHSFSRAACKMLDFPRLVNRVYDDGARIFIELGPRSTCSRWISDILGSREHLSVAADQLGVDNLTSLLRMLARLISHGVSIDISALYSVPQIPATVSTEVRQPYGQVTRAHQTFLQKRMDGLNQLGEMLQLQMSLLSQSPPVIEATRPAIFNESALQEFATGSIKACFGPEYAVYDNRRAPRIPNGDLLLVSRVIEIQAERYKLAPGARMVSEYDMPYQPWFYRDNAYPTIPYSIYMEMALQLCGFLSAYLGSSLAFPELDFYFRNLDGQGTLYKDIDLSGKTITNTVHLLSSITLEGIILQKFAFQLDLAGDIFYTGEASFGFFTEQAMQNQTGLDKGKPTQPWYQRLNMPIVPVADPAKYNQVQPGKPHYRLAQGQLDLIDTFVMVPNGGQYEQGYIYASKNLDPTDWFFYCHFYQDPVMPGSLGVEAILQAMQAFALELDLGQSFRSPRFEQVAPHTITWHYRGQVTRQNERFSLEIHIKRIDVTVERVTIIGDASLWRDDGLRIYEVLDIALGIEETRA